MKWCIAFPYAPNEPIREEAFNLVSAFYREHFPNVPQLTHSATPVGEPFLRAKTRNDLVRIAERDGYDIVCLIDADTLIHPDGIRRMVDMVEADPMLLGKPFSDGVNYDIDAQRQLAATLDPWPTAAFRDPGAAWIVRPETWWRAGGMDEGFTAWGGEDTAHLYMHVAAGGTVVTDKDANNRAAVKTQHAEKRWTDNAYWEETLTRELVVKELFERRRQWIPEWFEDRLNPDAASRWATRLRIEHKIWRTIQRHTRLRARRERLHGR